MSGRGEVCLGDLVRAVAGLRPEDGHTASAMAALLGGEHHLAPGTPPGTRALPEPLPGTAPAPESSAAGGVLAPVRPGLGATAVPTTVPPPACTDAGDDTGDPPADGTPDDGAVVPPGGAPGRPVRLAERRLDFSLVSAAGPRRAAERAASTAAAAEASPDLLRFAPAPCTPAYEPPWTPDWARGVMFAAVATPVAGRELNLRALLCRVSRHDAIRAVPRRLRPTTRRGAQLLLDHGPGMAPFQDDRLWLRELLGSVAGRNRVEVLRFRGVPGRGVVRRDPLDLQEYRPPPPGTPVVLVSDLGRLRPPFAGRWAARPGEWVDFVDTVVHSGCPVVCLTPYEPAAYPAALRARVAFIPLDRRISLRHAKEATAGVRRHLEGL
ncbi:hypothetical protein [Streptomyces griseocarneus]|uniref:hypothetical protein n=1 Tax=Streptomyces griseocarneus TaxID=51201 RepID=UPI00167E5ACA|nr:hypothetical protein [Streptomyces griseocarneus]MBZ6475768.1 hypothetical protein [Streptomyces griseocarneus]GHG50880.1 hypothetical protein GCM10018779_11380 [Streptomyces griseocarneus]